MLKSKSKKLAALCCAIALMVTCSISAFAATYTTKTITLPSYRNGTEISGTHVGTETYVKLNSITGGSAIYALVRHNGADVSPTATIGVGNAANLKLDVASGTAVTLVVGNDTWNIQTGSANITYSL